jgi:hypothetical protein
MTYKLYVSLNTHFFTKKGVKALKCITCTGFRRKDTEATGVTTRYYPLCAIGIVKIVSRRTARQMSAATTSSKNLACGRTTFVVIALRNITVLNITVRKL